MVYLMHNVWLLTTCSNPTDYRIHCSDDFQENCL